MIGRVADPADNPAVYEAFRRGWAIPAKPLLSRFLYDLNTGGLQGVPPEARILSIADADHAEGVRLTEPTPEEMEHWFVNRIDDTQTRRQLSSARAKVRSL